MSAGFRARVVLAASLVSASGAGAVLPGDSNRDARRSAADLPALVRILAGAPGNLGADANGDGFILTNDLDATVALLFEAPPVPSPTPTATPAASATLMAAPTPTATTTPSVSATPTFTVSATASPTPTASATSTPSGTPTPTASVTRSTTASPSASATSSPTVTPSASATSAVPAVFCRTLSPPLPIVEGLPGVTDEIVVAGENMIVDLNVRLEIAHSWVGDLVATLTHLETGTSVVLLDRPGIPASEFGCGHDGVSASLDDQAGRIAEASCLTSAASNPMAAIDGSVKPAGGLGAFHGENVGGTWRLGVTDQVTGDQGALLGWCLDVNSRAPLVTRFVCGGSGECVIPVGTPFTLSFEFFDPDGDAAAWSMTQVVDTGANQEIAGGAIAPAAGSGSVSVPFNPFFCPGPSCRLTEFDYVVVVVDAGGERSPPTRVHLTVPATP